MIACPRGLLSPLVLSGVGGDAVIAPQSTYRDPLPSATIGGR